MPPIKFTQVLSYSSEDPNFPATNLLCPDTFRKWKCAPNNTEKQSFIILKFEKLSSINSLDIGNDGSALIEVLVSREGVGDYQLLLVSSSFMSPMESMNGTNLHRVRMFGPDKLNKNVAKEKWDRMKVVCTQPFNPKTQYGVSFITARSLESEEGESSPKVTQLGNFKLRTEDDSDPISIGSAFAKRKEKTPLNLTGAAAIRAASREAAAANTTSPGTIKRKDHGSNRDSSPATKKPATESVRSPLVTGSPSGSPATTQNRHKKDESHRKPHSRPKRKEEKNHLQEKDKKKEQEKKPGKTKSQENANKPSTSGNDNQKTKAERKSKPFTSLMDNVVFAMSGFQNPERSNLRDKLIEMGAQYRADWAPGCTHLICAFTNTPKYRQVRGKGKIVTGKWITECYKNKIRYPWKRYGLEKHKDGSESEEEIWAEELMPKESKPVLKPPTPTPPSDNSETTEEMNFSDDEDTDDEIQKVLNRQQQESPDGSSGSEANSSKNSQVHKNKATKDTGKDTHPENTDSSLTTNGHKVTSDDNVYDEDTDIDEDLPDTSSLPLPPLEDYFKNKYFFLYGDMPDQKRKLLNRYITAFSGKVQDYMSEEVQFVISENKWDENFEEALNENPALQFVKSKWIWQCCDKKKLIPHQPYLIVP